MSLTQLTQDIRKIVRDVSDDVQSGDRYVDLGVTIKVVVADPSGDVLLEGCRPFRVLREHHRGRFIDTRATPPRFVDGPGGDSTSRLVWYCSEDQELVILHHESEPVGKLAIGGMGAGKTTAGIMWLYLRWLENIGSRNEIGITAPTETRLSLVLNELFKMFPPAWWTYNSETKVVTMCDGFRFRGVSTYRQSVKQGSRIQTFNWVGLFADELQDSIDEFVHMQARLRSRRDGRAKRLSTVTAKDDPAWRTLQGEITRSGIWMTHQLLGPNSPFVSPEHWNNMRRLMTERDYRRLVMAEDLPSESRVYNCFDRKISVQRIPFGARKITSLVIKKKIGGDGWGVGIGHDPGTAKAASVWLDAYEVPRAAAAELGCPIGEPIWFARAELFTNGDTPEQHAVKALALTRTKFGCNVRPDLERAHVRCHPLGSAEDKPDRSTLKTWERIGFNIRVSQYTKTGQGMGHIKKDSRIAVVNTLFEKRRLFLECNDRGVCETPLLLGALETMERDHRGRAEHEEKDVRHDKSDLPAALGYWLWPWEKEFAMALRTDINRDLAG